MTSTLDPAHFVSEQEAWSYFSGLPSSPRLVHRTGTTPWKKPSGFDWGLKEALIPVFGHKLVDVCGELGPKVVAYLDSVNVKFTTIDGVRFVFGGEPAGPITLWIGLLPESLSAEHAHTAERGCMALFNEFDNNDVEIEFRESIYTRSAGPKLLEPGSSLDPTVGVRGALTPALGLRIASKDTPHVEGTGGFHFAEGGDSDKVFLATAGHVFPPDAALTTTMSPQTPAHLVTTYNDFVTCIDDKI